MRRQRTWGARGGITERSQLGLSHGEGIHGDESRAVMNALA
ncbi:hypothetical protein [Microvirga calopogonii]|nr:hypothetical protein [Microvirga calopogonii]